MENQIPNPHPKNLTSTSQNKLEKELTYSKFESFKSTSETVSQSSTIDILDKKFQHKFLDTKFPEVVRHHKKFNSNPASPSYKKRNIKNLFSNLSIKSVKEELEELNINEQDSHKKKKSKLKLIKDGEEFNRKTRKHRRAASSQKDRCRSVGQLESVQEDKNEYCSNQMPELMKLSFVIDRKEYLSDLKFNNVSRNYNLGKIQTDDAIEEEKELVKHQFRDHNKAKSIISSNNSSSLTSPRISYIKNLRVDEIENKKKKQNQYEYDEDFEQQSDEIEIIEEEQNQNQKWSKSLDEQLQHIKQKLVEENQFIRRIVKSESIDENDTSRHFFDNEFCKLSSKIIYDEKDEEEDNKNSDSKSSINDYEQK